MLSKQRTYEVVTKEGVMYKIDDKNYFFNDHLAQEECDRRNNPPPPTTQENDGIW